MLQLIEILKSHYPKGDIKVGGDFCFLDSHGLEQINSPNLTHILGMDFYKGKFFTGMRKFKILEMVIGYNQKKGTFKLLCTPLFSNKYQNLIEDLNSINPKDKFLQITSEIVELFKLTNTNITPIQSNIGKYQIWFGDNKWRILTLGNNEKINILSEPNKKPELLWNKIKAKRNLIYSLSLILMTIWIWSLLYTAQFLEYDDNYANLLASFGLSILSLLTLIIIWFVNRRIVLESKWQTIIFLLVSSPITIYYVSTNYPYIFQAMLKG